jgi:chemotaxis protein methyltransferase CheR
LTYFIHDIGSDDLDRFINLLKESCGLDLGRDKAYLFSTRLSTLLVQTGSSSLGELYDKIKSSFNNDLLMQVIDAMTTQETKWFRDVATWKCIEEELMPQIAETAHKENRKMFVWSAACSTGQEPYSLAMLAMENPKIKTAFGVTLNDIVIQATDVSNGALSVAKAGKYSRIAMHRGKLGPKKDKYFTKDDGGKVWTINDTVKKLVHFKSFNLKDRITSANLFDMVLCRNVMVYFSQDLRRELLGRLYNCIRPGGFLVLGASEGIYGDSDRFNLIRGKDCIYYQR